MVSPPSVAHQVANLPPVGSLFAAFLGYNPMTTLLGPSLHTLTASQAAYLSGQTFFPNLISNPFIVGMHITFAFSVIMMLVGATASWLRGASPSRPAPVRVRRSDRGAEPASQLGVERGVGDSCGGAQWVRLRLPIRWRC